MKEKKEIKVRVTFSEGWEERFAKAAYELYLSVKTGKSSKSEPWEPQTL